MEEGKMCIGCWWERGHCFERTTNQVRSVKCDYPKFQQVFRGRNVGGGYATERQKDWLKYPFGE
jgi:hypothetical protein